MYSPGGLVQRRRQLSCFLFARVHERRRCVAGALSQRLDEVGFESKDCEVEERMTANAKTVNVSSWYE